MMDDRHLDALDKILRHKKCVWINAEYMRDGELAKKEFFLRKVDAEFRVGFDHYLDKYEDATDQYIAYIRKRFADLPSAVRYAIEALGMDEKDLLRV